MVNNEVIKEALKQTGLYLQDIMKQKNINKKKLSENSGVSRAIIDSVLDGSSEYTMPTLLRIIQSLDYHLFLADKEGEHLNFDHMVEKSDPDKAMDFKE